MDALKIDDGAVRLSINNDETRIITFYPTDSRFAADFFELSNIMQKKQAEIEAVEGKLTPEEELQLRVDTGSLMRSEIDRVFGPGTAQTAFGDHDNLGAFIQFFRGVTPYVAKARKREVDRYMAPAGDDGVMDA